MSATSNPHRQLSPTRRAQQGGEQPIGLLRGHCRDDCDRVTTVEQLLCGVIRGVADHGRVLAEGQPAGERTGPAATVRHPEAISARGASG